MALDISIFETIEPSRFVSFTIPNPSPNPSPPLASPLIRVAVLDSPIQLADAPPPSSSPPIVAAMFVPQHRESDWLFSTESGHLQLLLTSPNIQRLILIGQQPSIDPDSPSSVYRRQIDSDSLNDLEIALKPLVIALSPKGCFKNGNFSQVPIAIYEDNVVSSLVLEKCVGNFVGEMLVEDVEIETSNRGEREFRRRLRFKRMPNLVQTEIRIHPKLANCLDSIEIGGNNNNNDVELFSPDLGVLVHVYLVPMVASLALIGSWIEERVQVEVGFRPRALCLGIGGGALVGFLRTKLDFQVVGVEIDEEVLRVARKYFGLVDEDLVHLCLGDGIELIEKCGRGDNHFEALAHIDPQFNVIMVDLDSGDLRNGVSAPPIEFVRKEVLLAARSILSESGILVINVIPPSRSIYEMLIHEFKEVFCELFEIDVGNGENFILIAKASPTASLISDCENHFLKKLRLAISGAYMDCIKRI